MAHPEGMTATGQVGTLLGSCEAMVHPDTAKSKHKERPTRPALKCLYTVMNKQYRLVTDEVKPTARPLQRWENQQ